MTNSSDETSAADFLKDKNIQRATTLTPFLICLVLLMLCGLAGNTTVFVVYYRRFKPSSSRTFVLCMGLCDLLTNVWALVTEITDVCFNYTFYAACFCKVSKVVMGVLVLFSGLVLVVVAVERQKVVCGMYTKNQPLNRMLRLALFGCCAVAMVLSLPRAWLYGNRSAAFNETNITGVKCNIQDAYLTTHFPIVYNALNALLFVVIFIIMGVCYGRVGVHLWWHKKRISEQIRRASSSFGSDNPVRSGGVKKTEMDSSNVEHVLKTDPNDDSSPPDFHDTAQARHDSTRASRPSAFFQRQISNISSKVPFGARKAKHSTSSGGSGNVTLNLHAAQWAFRKRISSRTTLMLFVLTAIFVINFLPYLTVESLFALTPKHPVRDWDINVQYFFFRSYYLNSVINPFVYSFCSAKFRHEGRQLFRNLWNGLVKAVN